MTTAILGAGRLGTALARAFTRAHVEVLLANSSGAASVAAVAARRGLRVVPVSLEDAVGADTLFLALPFLRSSEVGRLKTDWSGTTVVDCTNAFLLPNRDAVLAGRLSSDITAGLFPGAELVKAFNQLPAPVLGADVPPERGRRVVFIASNIGGASARVADLARALGFSPVELGRIDLAGVLIQAQNALVLRNLFEASEP